MILRWLASSAWLGTTPLELAITRCEEILDEVGDHAASRAEVLRPLAGLHGFAGRFDLARVLFAESNAAFDDLGLTLSRALSHTEAVIEMLAGNFTGAEARLRSDCEILEALGESAQRSTTAALLARALLAQARHDEARDHADVGASLAEPNDVITHVLLGGVLARLDVADGRGDSAEARALEAVALAADTDFVHFHADALGELAAVLDALGRHEESAAVVAAALALYEQKGNVVSATAARARLDSFATV
jgi:ATP/maltotriose-dependent transcriptional regulator MalT